MNDRPRRIADCKVCYAPHDEEIHEATLRVRQWFQRQVTRNLDDGSLELGPDGFNQNEPDHDEFAHEVDDPALINQTT